MSRAKSMISSAVFLDDAFLELSFEAQAFYTHLSVQADNDGVVDGIKRIMRGFGCSDEAYQELVDAGYIQAIGNAVVIIHYWVNNNHDKKYGHGQHYGTVSKHFNLDADTRMYVPLELGTVVSGEPRENPTEELAPNINEYNPIEPNGSEENSNDSNQNQNQMNLSALKVSCPECGKDSIPSKDYMTGTWVTECMHCGSVTPLTDAPSSTEKVTS